MLDAKPKLFDLSQVAHFEFRVVKNESYMYSDKTNKVHVV